MDATDLLAIVVLVAVPANVVDWLLMQRGRFALAPQRGPVLYLSWVCCAVMLATAIARQLGWVPSSTMPWGAFLPLIIWQVGAIWLRHASKQPRES
jgi:hypothetical protein